MVVEDSVATSGTLHPDPPCQAMTLLRHASHGPAMTYLCPLSPSLTAKTGATAEQSKAVEHQSPTSL